mmetsp:Transcript_41402/g.107253  ORF Transcript_41402/g.107253 Transcript_41402/m.107253 type:complete len:250 (-) Transcript_41402:237-986(-)
MPRPSIPLTSSSRESSGKHITTFASTKGRRRGEGRSFPHKLLDLNIDNYSNSRSLLALLDLHVVVGGCFHLCAYSILVLDPVERLTKTNSLNFEVGSVQLCYFYPLDNEEFRHLKEGLAEKLEQECRHTVPLHLDRPCLAVVDIDHSQLNHVVEHCYHHLLEGFFQCVSPRIQLNISSVIAIFEFMLELLFYPHRVGPSFFALLLSAFFLACLFALACSSSFYLFFVHLLCFFHLFHYLLLSSSTFARR